MNPEIYHMQTPEYHGLERRQIGLETSFAEHSKTITKLLILSENNVNAMAKLEAWVAAHDADYRTVRERLLSQEVRHDATNKRIETLTAAVETAMNAYLADKNKLRGGWFIVTTIAAVIVGIVAIARSFGIL